MDEKAIFMCALEIEGQPERATYLDQACANDPALRRRIDKLLRAHDKAGGVLDSPPDALPGNTGDYQPATEGPGTVIGCYKLLQQIGEGGFGIVYMAEQDKPVHRRVALKIIKPGMDSAQVIARFEAERQALALMDHQNIARVFDAGTTRSGRPFFVMELVHGVPVTKYCDDNHLGMRERLELFVPICQAIQHAHQKGIIHRDVKPTNVMVTLYDGKPVPKVIDFGVAKAIEQRLTERTMFTQYGQIIGTFEYMSPEQAEMSGLGVDTRSDVYSLGVLLYELLAGSTPLSRERLRNAALSDMLRIIKEEEPQKPSTRLSTTEKLATIAAQRNTEPARLRRMVQGELDWIVMKCLEKDRTRRYETANALARDVQRFLGEEPVEACPPSATYRLRKIARKHRALLGIAAAFALLLVGGAIVSAWLAVRAHQAERRAQDALTSEALERQEAQIQRDRALQAEEHAQQRLEESRRAHAKARERFQMARGAVDEFLTKVSDSPEMKARGFETLRTKLLETASRFYEKFVQDAADYPEVQAERGRGYSRLARTYWQTGRTEQAQKAYLESIAIQRKLSDASPAEPNYQEDLGKSLHSLGELYTHLRKLAECEDILQEALTIQRKLAKTYPDQPAYQSELAETLNDLSFPYTYSDFRRTLALLEEALAVQKPLVAAHPEVADYRLMLGTIYLNLGNAHERLGQPALAGPDRKQSAAEFREAVRIDPDNPEGQDLLAAALARLGGQYSQNHLDLAQSVLSEAVDTDRRLSAGHPQVPDYASNLAIHQSSLAVVLSRAGRNQEAETAFKDAAGIIDRVSSDYPQDLGYLERRIVIHNRTGAFYRRTGHDALAEAEWKGIFTLYRNLADKNPAAIDGLILDAFCTPFAEMFRQAGRGKDAEQVWKEAVDLMNRVHTANPSRWLALTWLGSFQYRLAQHYQDQGQEDLAIASFKESATSWKNSLETRKSTATDPETLGTVSSAVEAFAKAKERAQALSLVRDYLAPARSQPPTSERANALANVGSALLELQSFAEAEELLRECLEIRLKLAPEKFTTFNAKSLLGAALVGQKKFAEAEPLLKGGFDGLKKTQNTVTPDSAKLRCRQAATRLVEFYETTGKKDEAAKWQRELEAFKVADK
jgi:serine/threonine protein kinase/tetratricopeptide (TPR) repeat protein